MSPFFSNPAQDSEPRSKVLQLTEDGDRGDLSDDRNCNSYPEQKEHSASLPEYAGQSRASYLANLLHGVEGSVMEGSRGKLEVVFSGPNTKPQSQASS